MTMVQTPSHLTKTRHGKRKRERSPVGDGGQAFASDLAELTKTANHAPPLQF